MAASGGMGFRLGDFAMAYGRSSWTGRRGRWQSGAPVPLMYRGKRLSAIEDESGVERRVLSKNAISCLTVDTSELDTMMSKTDLPDTALTMAGDIVVNGSRPFDVVCIDESSSGLVVHNGFIVIRFDESRSASVTDFDSFDQWYWAYAISGAIQGMRGQGLGAAPNENLTIESLGNAWIPSVDDEARRHISEELRRSALGVAEMSRRVHEMLDGAPSATRRETERLQPTDGREMRRGDDGAEPAGDAKSSSQEAADSVMVRFAAPTWLVEALDAEAKHMTLSRRAIITQWLAEKSREVDAER